MMSAIMLALVAAQAQEPKPVAPLASYVSDADYPADAIRRGASGAVQFTLDVDAGGVPIRCTITGPADPELDRATCAIFMARARFEPARDSAGRAVPGIVSSRMRWVLPEPEPFAPSQMVIAVHVAANGRVSCTLTVDGAEAAWPDPAACAAFAPSRRARRPRVGYTLTAIFSALAAGQAVPAPPAGDRGQLLYDAEAQLSIAPDGRVAQCQIVSHRIFRPAPVGTAQTYLCDRQQLAMMPPLPAIAPSGEVRILRLLIAVHRRADASDNR